MLKCLLWGILFASVVTANFVDDLAGEIAGLIRDTVTLRT